MISRYCRPVLSNIWNDSFRYSIWLRIEVLACEAQAALGNISQESLRIIQEKSGFNIDRINEIEGEVRHDVIAFLTSVAEHVGSDSRYIHMGMTSSDVVDTCFSYQLKRSGEVILSNIDTLLDSLKEKAENTKKVVCIGRSHGIHAEPITLGMKFARFYQEFKRNYNRLKNAIEEVSVCKISGAMGQFANIDHYVEEYVAENLALKPETISSQVIPRDRYAVFFSTLGIIASSIENIAIEIRHSQRTEVMELSECFSKGQKGSSAMPHKKNPILSENLTGLARMVRSAVVPALENVALWHERDISHSSVERFIAPMSCATLDFALDRLNGLINGLVIAEDNARENLEKSRGLIFSQKVLLKLVSAGFTRESAYEVVQESALETWENKDSTFLGNLRSKPILKDLMNQIESAFSYDDYIKNVDFIFSKVFN